MPLQTHKSFAFSFHVTLNIILIVFTISRVFGAIYTRIPFIFQNKRIILWTNSGDLTRNGNCFLRVREKSVNICPPLEPHYDIATNYPTQIGTIFMCILYHIYIYYNIPKQHNKLANSVLMNMFIAIFYVDYIISIKCKLYFSIKYYNK